MTNTDDSKPATRHTPEPWEVIPARGTMLAHVMGGDHCRLALLDDCHADQRERDANARRLVAAVNACQGIGTEALEQGVVDELLQACRMVVERWEQGDLAEAARACAAVVARATGRVAEASAMPRDQESGNLPRLREMDRRRFGEELRRKQRGR